MNIYKQIFIGSLCGSLAVAAVITFDPAFAQVANGKVTTNPPVYINNTANGLSLDTAGNLRVIPTGSVPGGADVDIIAVGGTPVVADNDPAPVPDPVLAVGGTAYGVLPSWNAGDRVSLTFQNRGALVTSFGGQINGDGVVNGGVAATTSLGLGALLVTGPYLFNGTSFDRARGNVDGTFVLQSATSSALTSPSNAVTTTAAGNIVAKASPGNFYGANLVTAGSAGYFMLFNTTSAPADGAVTPLRCWPVAANTSVSVGNALPLALSTGITMVFSTTGCFTKTTSTTAFMSVDYK